MKLAAVAFVAALFCLFAALHLQYGPEWEANGAVKAAIDRGDLRQAGEAAITAQHWDWIAEARFRKLRANRTQSELSEGMTLAEHAGANVEN